MIFARTEIERKVFGIKQTYLALRDYVDQAPGNITEKVGLVESDVNDLLHEAEQALRMVLSGTNLIPERARLAEADANVAKAAHYAHAIWAKGDDKDGLDDAMMLLREALLARSTMVDAELVRLLQYHESKTQ